MIRPFSKRYIWQGVVIFLLCIFCYSNSLMNGFMMDDYVILLSKIKLLKFDFSIFTNEVDGFYRPIGMGFLKLSYLFFGLNSMGYHVVNLLLFFSICILFLFIVRWLFINSGANFSETELIARANWVSFIAVALYCVHPINNLIINYKTASLEAVFTICMQVSFLAFLLHIDKQKKFYYLLSVFFYFCGLLSHEMSSFLPLYLLMVVYYLKGSRFKISLFLLWPYLLCFILYILIWSQISHRQHRMGGLFEIPFGVYIATLSQLLQWYMSKLFFPHHLLFSWNVPIVGGHLLARSRGFIFLLSLLAGLYFIFTKLKKRFEIFSLTLFLVGFIPFGIAAFVYASSTQTASIEPHWFYFSSIGIFSLVACFFVSLAWHWNRLLKVLAFCGLIIILAMMTRQSNVVWKDNTTYCKYWIKLNPFNSTPYYFLLESKRMGGQELRSLPDIARNYPNADVAYSIRGYAYLLQGNLIQAISNYTKAIEINPKDAMAYYNRGNVYMKQNDLTQALPDYNKAIEINPNYADAYYNRGNVYMRQNNLTQALSDYNRAIEISPDYADAYTNRGIFYSKQGNFPQALSDYNKAIEINPKLAGAYYNRGIFYSVQGNFTQALSDYNKVIEINPNYAEVYYNRGLAYYSEKEYDKAWADVSKAEELGGTVNPDFIKLLKQASGKNK